MPKKKAAKKAANTNKKQPKKRAREVAVEDKQQRIPGTFDEPSAKLAKVAVSLRKARLDKKDAQDRCGVLLDELKVLAKEEHVGSVQVDGGRFLFEESDDLDVKWQPDKDDS